MAEEGKKSSDGLFVSLDPKLNLTEKISGISRENLLKRISEERSEKPSADKKPRKYKITALPVVETDLPEDGIFFYNWFNYIRLCWAHHLVPHIRPEDLAFTFFCTVSKHVVDHPDNFRSLFTTKKEGKTDIIIPFRGSVVLTLPEIMDEIDKVAPIDVFHLLPEFSTDTEATKWARMSAFAEMVSPYYSYAMMLCGFPGMRITGTAVDWKKLLDTIQVFRTLFDSADKVKSLEKYFVGMTKVVRNLYNQVRTDVPDTDFLNKLYIHTLCGSGHQEAVAGWICDVYNVPEGEMPETFPSHITSVPYKIVGVGIIDGSYLLHYGLHEGRVEGNELIPQYHWLVNKN